MQRNPDIIGIGAGPCNLWALIQVKLRDPSKNIVIFEKRATYARPHLLMIEPESLNDCAEDAAFKTLAASFGKRIRTNDLQKKLADFAKTIGIEINQREVTDCAALTQEFPYTKRFVSASGAKGIVRKQIFNNEMREGSEELKYIAEVKYSVQGVTKALHLFWHVTAIECHVKHLCTEHVGKEADGTTPVTLRFFISEEEFVALEEARGGIAYNLNDADKIPPLLLASMNNWLECRQEILHEVRVPDSEKITVTSLGVYCSKDFVKIQPDQTEWIILGDEAFGVPFFRSLNNGLLCGTELAKHLAVDASMQAYIDFTHQLATAEIKKAKHKGKGIDALEKVVTIGRGDAIPMLRETKIVGLSRNLFTPTLSTALKKSLAERNRIASESKSFAHTK